jgi:hypothetical protein
MVKPNRKTRDSRLNKIQQKWIAPPRGKQWARIFIDEMDGESWRSLSVNARRMYDALICQHFRYWQGSNGELQVSYSGFQRAGIPNRREVAAAKRELIAAGKIACESRPNPDPNLKRPLTVYELPTYRKSGGFLQEANRAFVWIPVEVMESPAWCNLSINAKRVMDRLLIENRRHEGEGNGKLRVSYSQFVGHGIGRRLIAPALRELAEAGLLDISTEPRMGEYVGPNLYRITFIGTVDGPATWRMPNVTPLPKKPKRKSRKEVLLDDFKRVCRQ